MKTLGWYKELWSELFQISGTKLHHFFIRKKLKLKVFCCLTAWQKRRNKSPWPESASVRSFRFLGSILQQLAVYEHFDSLACQVHQQPICEMYQWMSRRGSGFLGDDLQIITRQLHRLLLHQVDANLIKLQFLKLSAQKPKFPPHFIHVCLPFTKWNTKCF